MTTGLIRAVDLIRNDLDRCGVPLSGKMPPLLTLCLSDVISEAMYYSFIKANLNREQLITSNLNVLRPDCLCSIAGIEVRITCDQRVDDAVRRLFK